MNKNKQKQPILNSIDPPIYKSFLLQLVTKANEEDKKKENEYDFVIIDTTEDGAINLPIDEFDFYKTCKKRLKKCLEKFKMMY